MQGGCRTVSAESEVDGEGPAGAGGDELATCEGHINELGGHTVPRGESGFLDAALLGLEKVITLVL